MDEEGNVAVSRAPRSAEEQVRAPSLLAQVSRRLTLPLCQLSSVSQSLTHTNSSTEMASTLEADESMPLHTRRQYCFISRTAESELMI